MVEIGSNGGVERIEREERLPNMALQDHTHGLVRLTAIAVATQPSLRVGALPRTAYWAVMLDQTSNGRVAAAAVMDGAGTIARQPMANCCGRQRCYQRQIGLPKRCEKQQRLFYMEVAVAMEVF